MQLLDFTNTPLNHPRPTGLLTSTHWTGAGRRLRSSWTHARCVVCMCGMSCAVFPAGGHVGQSWLTGIAQHKLANKCLSNSAARTSASSVQLQCASLRKQPLERTPARLPLSTHSVVHAVSCCTHNTSPHSASPHSSLHYSPQALGISVLRTWFFNLGMPKDFDRYDARQIAGMDYVIWAAKRRGLMLVLTMGNLWNAYRGPEDFLLWATGSLGA